MTSSPALTDYIQQELDTLDHSLPGITRCHVVVDQPHRHVRRGRQFRVRLELERKGRPVTIDHSKEGGNAHETAQQAVRDAFEAAKRRLHGERERRRARSKM